MDIIRHRTAKNPAEWFTGDVWLDPPCHPPSPPTITSHDGQL